MSRRIVAVAVVIVLIASALAGYGAVANSAATPAAPLASSLTPSVANTHPALSDIAINTYNGLGAATTVFCTGSCLSFDGDAEPGANTLYLSIRDSAADLTVNVTVNDPNATRDGLVNPVFSATLGIDQITHENLTPTDNHLSYTFPSTLVIGGGWNITASGPLGGFTSLNLTLATYSLALESVPNNNAVTVPGESLAVSWVVTASSNGALYTAFTSLVATGTYNGTAQNLLTPGLYPLPHAGAGTWNVQVPDNATPNTQIFLQVWAVTNVSGGIAENESAELSFWVGSPYISEVTAGPSAGCSNSNYPYTFVSGSPAFVCAWVGAQVLFHNTEYVPGLEVQIGFWNGIQTVTPGGSPPTMLMTTGNAPIAFSFIPTAPQFSSQYTYPFGNSFNLTATDPAATSPGYPAAYQNSSFYVIPSASSGAVLVTLNAVDYAVGQTVFANWTLGSSNASAVGALVATQWILVIGAGIVATGPILSTAPTGPVEVALPAGFVGEFAVGIVATNATGFFYGISSAYAEQPTLFLSSAGGSWYEPGQSLSFPAQLAPSELPGTTLYYNVTGEWYSYTLEETQSVGVVAVGIVGSSGVVDFTVPTNNPATFYDVSVWAQSPSAGVYATNSVEVDLATGFTVLIGVTTASSYSDGSYQPGQTIQVSWSLSPLGPVPLPGHYYVYIYLGTTLVTPAWYTTSSSGTVSLTIPSNTPSGLQYIELEVDAHNVYGPSCYDTDYCYAESGITVNAHPSVLSMELGAGSGLTVGWLILLIVIIVVAVLLVLMIRRGRAPPMTTSTYSATSGTMAPPAPAPSTPPATEWQPSPPAADAPPPLPTPPTGPE